MMMIKKYQRKKEKTGNNLPVMRRGLKMLLQTAQLR